MGLVTGLEAGLLTSIAQGWQGELLGEWNPYSRKGNWCFSVRGLSQTFTSSVKFQILSWCEPSPHSEGRHRHRHLHVR